MRTPSFKHLVLVFFTAAIFLAGCQKEEYKIPDPVSDLTNDAIKRSLGPNIVSQTIEFAYAMALPKEKGKLVLAEVEASIAGASGTFLQNNSFTTGGAGQDVPVLVGEPSVNKDNRTSVTFNVDTNAATLRYFYVIPEEARGKTVSFTFSATASNGSKVTYKLGPYNISKMDIKRLIAVSNNNNAYISIEDMAVYNATSAVGVAGKIDLVYLFRTTPSAFLHGLVSPAADPIYLPGVTLPAGVNRSSKVRREFGVQDRNLANLQFGIYVDDRDFQEIQLANSPNYAIGLRAEASTWVETADGKYRAYIYVNAVSTASGGSAVISILRYAL